MTLTREPRTVVAAGRRRIFRPEAVERYVHRGEDQVLPPLANPTMFLLLWALLGLFGAALALVARAEVVTYVPAVGVAGAAEDALIVLVEPEEAAGLVPGATVVAAGERGLVRWSGSVAERLPGVLSPAEAVRRFQLTGPAACAVTGPVAAAVVAVDGVPTDLRRPGAVLSLRVETGEERLLSLLVEGGGRRRG